jgi:hypothetical protein
MGSPKLKPGDLIALRDGEATRAGVEIALGRNTEAQRELLEARLLALAFTMTGKATSSQAPPDPETLEAYVTGALTGQRLAAFEGSVRGDPRAFAALVAFKDAYFGLGRQRASTWSPPPSRREELGVLMVRPYGGRVALWWHSAGLNFPRANRRPAIAAEVIDPRPPDDFDRDRSKRREMRRREVEALLRMFEESASLNEWLSQGFSQELNQLRSDLLMATKTGDPDVLRRLQAALRRLADRADHTQSMFRKMERRIDETAQSLERESEAETMAFLAAEPDAEPDRDAGRNAGRDEMEIPTAAADLWFGADPRREGGLALRIQPISREAAEFTWIRPGVDFELLAPAPGRGLPLGVIDGEAMLLITRPGARSQVIRVRAEGARPG